MSSSEKSSAVKRDFPRMCLRLAHDDERSDLLALIAEAYRVEIDPRDGFNIGPKYLLVLVNLDTGDYMGAIGLHGDPLETALYFGWKNLQAVEPELKADKTLEICRQAVFEPYRHAGFFVSPILMLGAGIMAPGFGAKWIVANQQPRLRAYTRHVLGIPLIAPNLPVVNRPDGYEDSPFWDTAVPLIIPLGKAGFTLAWRVFFENGLMGKLVIEDFIPPDPILNSFMSMPHTP